MDKLFEKIYSSVETYDQMLDDSKKKWEEVHQLKPKGMDDGEFNNLIINSRFTRKLINEFIANNPYKCKELIYAGANKEYLYNYVSRIDNSKLSVEQKELIEDLHNIRRQKNFPYAYDDEISDVRKITKDEYKKLLDKLENKEDFTFEEQDKFVLKDSNYYIAIDNSSGNMWVEEFKNQERAERYLHGEEIDKLKAEEEHTYKIFIYENKEDYEKGEPFEYLNNFSNLEEAKNELRKVVKLNNYFSGNVLAEETGIERYSYYSEPEIERYNYIFECTLSYFSDTYKNQFLLVKNPNDLYTDFEIDLKGNFGFNCDYEVIKPKLVATIHSVEDLKQFCKNNNIMIPEERIKENGFIAGGSVEEGLFINNNLEPIDWVENLEESEEETI